MTYGCVPRGGSNTDWILQARRILTTAPSAVSVPTAPDGPTHSTHWCAATTCQLINNEKLLGELATSVAERPSAWSHEVRILDDPASSGNLSLGLNRGGDRALNNALHLLAVTRRLVIHEKRQCLKTTRRRSYGQEIHRCIKDCMECRIYRTLRAASELANAA